MNPRPRFAALALMALTVTALLPVPHHAVTAASIGSAVRASIEQPAGLARRVGHPPSPPVRPSSTTSTTSTTTAPAPPPTTTTTTQAPQPVQAEPAPTGEIEQMIYDVFGDAGAAAVQVARCESGLRPTAVNGQYRGLFQLGDYHRGRAAARGYSWDQMFEAYPNIVVAHDLYLEAGWQPWSCRP